MNTPGLVIRGRHITQHPGPRESQNGQAKWYGEVVESYDGCVKVRVDDELHPDFWLEIFIPKACLSDDDDPVTEEWLVECGCVKFDDGFVPDGDVAVTISRSAAQSNVWSIWIEDAYWPVDIHCRGQVRRLCKELGIELVVLSGQR